MLLGLRIHDAAPGTLLERLASLHEQGFACGHLALSKACPEIPFTPEALTPGLAMHLRHLFESTHMDAAVLGCYLNIATPDPAEWAQTLRLYEAHLRLAPLMGCGVVGTETGAPNVGYRPEPACRTEEALELLGGRLRQIVRIAESCGALLAIEPVCRHIVYDARRARRVLDEIASPNLRIILDPVNLIPDEDWQRADEIVEEALELLGDATDVLHLKDFLVQDGRLSFVAPGLGRMDYRPLLRYVKAHKPMIHATLEDTRPDNAVAARAYLERLYREL